jgi:hypothetical protein
LGDEREVGLKVVFKTNAVESFLRRDKGECYHEEIFINISLRVEIGYFYVFLYLADGRSR